MTRFKLNLFKPAQRFGKIVKILDQNPSLNFKVFPKEDATVKFGKKYWFPKM